MILCFLEFICPYGLIVLYFLILLVSVILVMEDIFVVVEIDVIWNFPYLNGVIVNESLLLFILLEELWLEEPTAIHYIFLDVSEDSVDSFSIILFGVFYFDLRILLDSVVFFKTNIELVCMEGLHSVKVLGVGIFFGLNIFDKVFIPELRLGITMCAGMNRDDEVWLNDLSLKLSIGRI